MENKYGWTSEEIKLITKLLKKDKTISKNKRWRQKNSILGKCQCCGKDLEPDKYQCAHRLLSKKLNKVFNNAAKMGWMIKHPNGAFGLTDPPHSMEKIFGRTRFE